MNKWIRFFKTWNETIWFLLALALFIILPVFFWWANPGIGRQHIGILQAAVISFLFFQFAALVAWFTFRFNFPRLYEYFSEHMENDLVQTKENKAEHENIKYRVRSTLTIYIIYLASMIVVEIAVLFMHLTW